MSDSRQNLSGFNYSQDNPTLAPDGKPLSQYVSILPQGYQGDVAGQSGNGGDIYQNLLQFGLATMAAGSRPGATTLGALGEGGLAATKSSRELQELNAKTGLQKAQTNYYGAQTTKDIIPLQMQLMQQRQYRIAYGQPTDDIDQALAQLKQMAGSRVGATNIMGLGNTASAPSAVDPNAAPGTAGSTFTADPNQPGAELRPVSASAPSAPSAAPTGAPSAAPAQQQFDPQRIRQIAIGQMAPSNRAEAYQAAGFAAHVLGDAKTSEKLQEYALKLPEGAMLTAGGGIDNTPGFVRSQAQLKGATTGAEAWAKVAPSLYEKRLSPYDLREGGIHVDPVTGQYVQGEQRVTTVDPTTGATYLTPAPMGISTGNVNGLGGGGKGVNVDGAPPAAAGGAAPTGQPAQQRFQTGLPPGQHEIIEGAAKNYNEEGKKAYQASQDMKASLEFINRDLDMMGEKGFLAAGSGADTRVAFAKAINSAQQAAGMTPSFDPNKIAAWEDFKKESTLGGMKGLSAMFGGSREAASIINTSIGAFPHPENTFQGAKLLTSAFTEAANREIDKRNFETNMAVDKGGNLTGVNETFNEKFPPAMYSRRAISKVQPYAVKDGDSQEDVMRRYLPGTYVKLPSGQVKVLPGPASVPLNGAPSGQ